MNWDPLSETPNVILKWWNMSAFPWGWLSSGLNGASCLLFYAWREPVNWVPDRLASLRRGSGRSSRWESARTHCNEAVIKHRGHQVGNKSTLAMRSKHCSVDKWKGLLRGDCTLNLKEAATLAQEPTRVAKKHYGVMC